MSLVEAAHVKTNHFSELKAKGEALDYAAECMPFAYSYLQGSQAQRQPVFLYKCLAMPIGPIAMA